MKLPMFFAEFFVVAVSLVVFGCMRGFVGFAPPFSVPIVRDSPIEIDLEFTVKNGGEYAFFISFLCPRKNECEEIVAAGVGNGERVSSLSPRGKSFSIDLTISEKRVKIGRDLLVRRLLQIVWHLVLGMVIPRKRKSLPCNFLLGVTKFLQELSSSTLI